MQAHFYTRVTRSIQVGTEQCEQVPQVDIGDLSHCTIIASNW